MLRKEVGLVAGLGLRKRDSAELAYDLTHHLGPALDKRHSIGIEKSSIPSSQDYSDQRTFSD